MELTYFHRLGNGEICKEEAWGGGGEAPGRGCREGGKEGRFFWGAEIPTKFVIEF